VRKQQFTPLEQLDVQPWLFLRIFLEANPKEIQLKDKAHQPKKEASKKKFEMRFGESAYWRGYLLKQKLKKM